MTSSVWHHPKSRNTDANTDKAQAMASKGYVRFEAVASQREASSIGAGQKAPLASSSNQRYTVPYNSITDFVWIFGLDCNNIF